MGNSESRISHSEPGRVHAVEPHESPDKPNHRQHSWGRTQPLDAWSGIWLSRPSKAWGNGQFKEPLLLPLSSLLFPTAPCSPAFRVSAGVIPGKRVWIWGLSSS